MKHFFPFWDEKFDSLNGEADTVLRGQTGRTKFYKQIFKETTAKRDKKNEAST